MPFWVLGFECVPVLYANGLLAAEVFTPYRFVRLHVLQHDIYTITLDSSYSPNWMRHSTAQRVEKVIEKAFSIGIGQFVDMSDADALRR